MTDALRAAATVPTAMGVLVIVIGVLRALARPGRAAGTLAGAFGVGLELFLAAGLLRLAALQNLESLGLAAFIVALRRLISAGVRFGVRASEA